MEVSLVGGITLRKILISRLLIIIPLRYGFIVGGRAKRFAVFSELLSILFANLNTRGKKPN